MPPHGMTRRFVRRLFPISVLAVLSALIGVFTSVLVAPSASPAPTFTEYPLPTANSHPEAITSGPDGALWFLDRAWWRILNTNDNPTCVGSLWPWAVRYLKGRQP